MEQETQLVEDISNIIKEAIEVSLGDNTYTHAKVNQWTSNVIESCLGQLVALKEAHKYIVTCAIMQKKEEAGLHTANSFYWDNTTDGCCTVRWENKTMYCIVSVFGLSPI